ncbi:MAG: hypothetical protein EXS16_12565 [Gemmataceae bacterium]|nr:hypothetical protein [Gemmataceae bacterium]
MRSPTALTLKALRQRGSIACVVERWIAQAGIRVDAFGFADVLVADPLERRITLVQATSLSNVSARVAKIRSKPEAATWIEAGGAIEVWGWIKRGGIWRVKIVAIEGGELEPVVVVKPKRKPRGNWNPVELFS